MTGFDRADWVHRLGFSLDDFQERALDAVDAGHHVLVAAPTGAGKTVPAEYAVASTLAAGRRAFYTTPIKALSNQKFADLTAIHGAGQVGLLTGDHSVHPDAPIVVMTTEVLRNMIYARSSALTHLGTVVLDEVHYLRDPYRGPVWEEVIIHLDQAVQLVCLSATVSNTDELGEWLTTVRGRSEVVVSHHRPVPLHHHYAVFDRGPDRLHVLPVLADPESDRGRVHPKLESLLTSASRHTGGGRGGRRRLVTPRRAEVVDHLDDEGLLPAIYFIFSRAACSDAARDLAGTGRRYTTPQEADEIEAIVGSRVAALEPTDLEALGYPSFLAALRHGIAPHHAGMVPAFREAVEACFVAGLVRVVFATETLALGINMPAKTVAIEKLSKFTGERREPLSPADYTQLTGRAGRRGIDTVGHAVVLHSPWVPHDQVARLVASRSYTLVSAFRPNYNMAANLVRRHEPEEAHRLLNLSFAQFQGNRAVVGLERRLAEVEQRLAQERAAARCERGDIEAVAHRRGVASSDRPKPNDLAKLRPGDVIVLPGRSTGKPGVVIAVAERRNGSVRVTAVSHNGRRLQLGADDFDGLPQRLGHVDLPQPYRPTSKAFQRDVAKALRSIRRPEPETSSLPADAGGQPAVDPVLTCPDLDRHLAAHKEAQRQERRAVTLRKRIESESGSFARQLERILDLLERWGYVDGWELTDAGELLARTYHELDLLVAESMRSGLLDGLDPASLAGVVSTFTYEQRGPGDAEQPWFPSKEVERRADHIASLAHALNVAEDEAAVNLSRPVDAGFVAAAHGWAAGGSLDDLLDSEAVTGGDFVRNMRQLIDLLRQVADLSPNEQTRQAARQALAKVDRGVVADAAHL